jgi:hypothetical protein
LEQQQPPAMLLPPPPMLQQTLLHPEQQQQPMQMQYQQLPVTGQMMVPLHQQEQQQLPMIPVQPSHTLLHQQEQQTQSPHVSQYVPSTQQPQTGRQVVRMGSGGHDFGQSQMQLAHASPSIPSSAGSSSSMHQQQQQQYQQQQGAFVGSHQVPQSHMPAAMQQQIGMLPPHMSNQQQQQQLRYGPVGWHMQQQHPPAQGYGSPTMVPVGGVSAPGGSGYMPPAISSGMPAMTHNQQQPQQPEQQQQSRGEEPPTGKWGPEELRQLLDILGDQRQQQQQQPSLLQQHQHLQQCLGCSAGSLPGSASMSPHVPEEEVEQVNNGHGHTGHALYNTNMTAGPNGRPGMRLNDVSCQIGAMGMTTAGLAAAGDSRDGCQTMVAPVQALGQVVQTGAAAASARM